MRSTEITISKHDGMDVVQYSLDSMDVYDEAVRDKALHSQNIAYFEYTDVDGRRVVTAYIKGKSTLESVIKNTLSKEMVVSIIRGLTSIINLTQKGIPAEYIVKEPKYIYFDEATSEIHFVIIPVKQETAANAQMPDFFRNILSRMIFDEYDKDNYVAVLLSTINAGDFSVDRLRQALDTMVPEQKQQTDKTPHTDNTPQVKPVSMSPNQTAPVSEPRQVSYTAQAHTQLLQTPTPSLNTKGTEMTHGNLVGQMGTRPVPHIVRKKTGEVINITRSGFVIGKSKTKTDYTIEDNPAISRVHCTIIQRDGVNYIKDNNSTNHTYLNGVELAPGKEQLLKNKTIIHMGDEEFTFLLRKSE